MLKLIVLKRFLFLFILIFSASLVQALEIEVKPAVAWQGKVISVKITSAEDFSSIKARFIGKTFTCFKDGSDFKGIVGVPLNQKPGRYPLRLTAYRKQGKKENFRLLISVEATSFPVSKFYLKPSRNKLRSPKIVNNEWFRIEKVLLVEDLLNKRSDLFVLPAKGPISQGFGHREIINDKLAGQHRGVDFAVPVSTEVIAPNNGKVVFADQLQAFGGAMVVDHGQGIQTLYFHLSKFIAKVGQDVKKGSVIALSGNSGISSGPHLHWGMSVHNLRVDPMQWVKNEI